MQVQRYLVLLALVALMTTGIVYYGSWTREMLACDASGYTDDVYLAYCNSPTYGDYEHGAFYDSLEREAVESLRKADVVILGNSRTQAAFSTDATREFFEKQGLRYYVAGFGYGELGAFALKVIQKLDLRPKALIINSDPFFLNDLTVAANNVVNPTLGTRIQYRLKQVLQPIHRALCGTPNFLCTYQYPALFRSKETGSWVWVSVLGYDRKVPIGPRAEFNRDLVAGIAQNAERYLTAVPVPSRCVVLTATPNAETDYDHLARAVGLKAGSPVEIPRLDNLITTDGSHLNRDSAERWSSAFLEMAKKAIQSCV